MKNSGRKYMKGGADEEKQSGGFLGMLGLGGKKDEPNTNNGSNSMLTDLTNTAKGYVGMRQEGESEIAHLQGDDAMYFRDEFHQCDPEWSVTKYIKEVGYDILFNE